MKKIGFIGLGIMGKSMALNLLKNGFPLIVYNRTKSKAEELAEQGAEVADNPADAAREASVIITMISNDDALREVFYGEQGILSGIKGNQTVIDSSTVSPTLSRQLYADCKAKSSSFLDAPVTGSKEGARDGTLTFMVGGDREVMEAHLDVFQAMGKKTVYVGPSGSGSQLKLAHNTVVAINTAAVCEGVSMAYKAGIDPAVFLDVLYSGGGNSRAAEMKGPKIIARDFDTHFSLKWMLKDLKLASALGDQLNAVSPLLGAVKQLFQEAVNAEIGEEDVSALIKVYEQAMNIKVESQSSEA